MKNIALFENASKSEAIQWAEFAANKLINLGVNCCASPELVDRFNPKLKEFVKSCSAASFEKFADIVISFGGDGTMLSAARMLVNTEIPIMGINVGKLGFLAEFSVKNLEKSINDILNGNYRIVDRTVLETNFEGEVLHALNDFVIEKKDSSRMITIEAFANNHCIGIYRADGLILTTPTGSTAYSLSCGGPIISPSTAVFCLTPISPHSLTFRPLVIPDTNEIMLKVHVPSGKVSLVADGQVERILQNDETVIFKKSKALIKLIKPLDSSYYDLLRKKLLWAANTITENPIKID